MTVYRWRVVCSSGYIKVDILCGQHHRHLSVPLNHSNPVHTNTTSEQYIPSFLLLFYGTLRSFVGPSSGTGYKHMLQKRARLPRKYAGPSFSVLTHPRTAVVSVSPRTFCFRNYSLYTDVQKNLIVKIYFYEVSYLLTVLFNDAANFVHCVAYLANE